jgi:hypothetical protein
LSSLEIKRAGVSRRRSQGHFDLPMRGGTAVVTHRERLRTKNPAAA